MKNIIVAVTGGISAYKSLDIISALLTNDYNVKVISTDNALNFTTCHALNVISRGQYITETPGETKHIDLAKWCDIFLIAPATANTIAKIAHGLADNLLTNTFLALPQGKIKIICPAMNTNMWNNQITQKNISIINDFCHIIPPVEGLLACGDFGIGKLAPTKTIIQYINSILNKWSFPLKSELIGQTEDSFSFLDIDWHNQCQVPTKSHAGAFGVRRKHDIHKGVDLYAELNSPVFAVEDGEIVDICPFTGEIDGFPWWENTWGVYIKGQSGIVVYGEILPLPSLKIGDYIKKSQHIGNVLRVLKKDNGRPSSMLHLELHDVNHIHTEQWEIGGEKPIGVLNPTNYLLNAINVDKNYDNKSAL